LKYLYIIILFITFSCGTNALRKSKEYTYVDKDGLTRRYTLDSLGNKLVRPEIIKTKAPVYPVEAQKQGIESIVVVKFTIQESGKIASLNIEKGHPIFYPAAIEAAKGYEFKPALKNNIPIKTKWTLPFRFRLKPKLKTKVKTKRY